MYLLLTTVYFIQPKPLVESNRNELDVDINGILIVIFLNNSSFPILYETRDRISICVAGIMFIAIKRSTMDKKTL